NFEYPVLKSIADPESPVDSCLAGLQAAGLVVEVAGQPGREYAFRHSLTQEAAYNSILLKRRREFHGQVGEALEAVPADPLDAIAPVLGQHFLEARDRRAVTYYSLAGDAAARLYANTEAAWHFARALEAAQHHASTPVEALVHAYLGRGHALELNSHLNEA